MSILQVQVGPNPVSVQVQSSGIAYASRIVREANVDVGSASAAADAAAASAAEAAAAVETVPALISNKAEKDLSDVEGADFGGKVFPPAALGSADLTPRALATAKAENLVLQAVDFGVVADNVTDDGPAWLAVIAAAKAEGRFVEIHTPQKGVSRVGNTVLIDADHILIRGPGAGISHDVAGSPSPFSFAPVSGFSGTILKHASPVNASGPRITGGGFVGVSVLGRPSRALHVQSVFGGHYDLYVGPVTGPQAILFDCLYDYRAGGNSQLGESGDNQGFSLKVRGRVTGENGGNGSAHCVEFSGSGSTSGSLYASGNTSLVNYVDISCRTHNGHAFYSSNSDNIGAGGRNPVLIQHYATGSGRPAYIRGNRELPAGGLGDDIHLFISSNRAPYFEGTEVAGVTAAANGSVALDNSNSSPLPVLGTGANRVSVIKLTDNYYARLFTPLAATDGYTMGLIAALGSSSLGLGVADGGAGAVLMRLASGGTIRIGESSAERARFLLGGDLEGININGNLEVTELKATAGGIICKPFEGSVAPLDDGHLSFDVQESTATTSTLRFFYKSADGTSTQAGYVDLEEI